MSALALSAVRRTPHIFESFWPHESAWPAQPDQALNTPLVVEKSTNAAVLAPEASTKDITSNQGVLTPAMEQAIEKGKENFKIRVYEKEFSPHEKQVIVLAGETHIKGKAASESGRELLSAFPVRGLEGVGDATTFGDHVFRVGLFPYFLVLELASLLTRRGGSFVRGSTIADSPTTPVIEQGIPSEATNIHLEEKGQKVSLIGECSKIVTALPFFAIQVGLLNLITHGIPQVGPFVGQVSSAFWSINRWILDTTILGGFLAMCLPDRLKKNSFFREVYKALNIRNAWILDERNEIMIGNLLEHIQKSEKKTPILTVVGSAHIDGMGKLLEEAGYNRIEEKKSVSTDS